MSGYLGSIGFGYPAAMGAWAARARTRPIVAVTGDGGFAQYMAELTTAVKHGMNITHVLLNNGQLGKIARSSAPASGTSGRPSLHNPDFSDVRAHLRRARHPRDRPRRARRRARRGPRARRAGPGRGDDRPRPRLSRKDPVTELTEKQAELCERSTTDYSDLKALFINCTLKRVARALATPQGLIDISMEIMRRNGVQVDGDPRGRPRHRHRRLART